MNKERTKMPSKPKLSEEAKKKIDIISRQVYLIGYSDGKKQKETPYKYTANSDKAKKLYTEIEQLMAEAVEKDRLSRPYYYKTVSPEKKRKWQENRKMRFKTDPEWTARYYAYQREYKKNKKLSAMRGESNITGTEDV